MAEEPRDVHGEALATVRTAQDWLDGHKSTHSARKSDVKALIDAVLSLTARDHPEPEITEAIGAALNALRYPHSDHRTTYATVTRILEAALRVPVGEGEQ